MYEYFPSFTFGGRVFPGHTANGHFLLLGAIRSAKSTLIERLMRDVIPHVGRIPDYRVLYYNAKGDAISFLSSIRGFDYKNRLQLLDCFDTRSLFWNLAADIPNHTVAAEIAATLCPNQGETRGSQENAFFQRQAVLFQKEAFVAMHELAGANWTLRDLLNALRTREDLVRLFSATFDGAAKLAKYQKTRETFDNISQTIDSFTEYFSSVAAAWHHGNGAPLSLSDWVNKPGAESVLVLGYNADARESINRLNAAVFKRIVQLLAARPDSETSRTWVVLDELPQIGELPLLLDLIRFCRTKGAAVVIAAQSLVGMERVYPRHMLEELVSNTAFKALLRTNGYADASFAADQCGKTLEKRWSEGTSETTTKGWSENWTPGIFPSTGSRSSGRHESVAKGTTKSFNFVDADRIKPDYFLHQMRPPSKERGVDGVFICDQPKSKYADVNLPYGVWFGPIPSDDFLPGIQAKKEAAKWIKDFDPIPNDHHALPPWTPKERAALFRQAKPDTPYPDIPDFSV